jgi:nitroreductase
MEIPFSKWHAAIPYRRSRRNYNSTDLEPDLLSHMQNLCRDFRPFPQARAELTTQSPDAIFGAMTGGYGIIRGATAFIAFIGDMDDPHIQEKVGYIGEGLILEATAMDLATCWVAGTFNRKATYSIVSIGKKEKVLAVTPIGHSPKKYSRIERTMMGFIAPHRRKPLAELTTGIDAEAMPHWMKMALDAARLAPSAINRQPWRFHVEPNSITVSVNRPKRQLGISKRLDCGIAMLHIEVAALDCGVHGEWEFLDTPKVARFTVAGGG